MNSNKYDVSVVIPIYNSELFLDEAIQSVLNQSLKLVELILVNDGSVDRSALICEKYAREYKHVHYFEQKNSGVSVARNRGLEEANGSYVFFLDSDDSIAHEFLEDAFEKASKNQSDIVAIGENYCFELDQITALPTCAMFLKRDFLEKYADIRFPVDIQPCEDGLFSHQLLAVTNQVCLYPEGNYYYRQHDNQNHIIINLNTSKVLIQITEWLNILEKFYTRYVLYKSHTFHLALFIEHEPFELRYLGMSFDDGQRKHLFELIRTFMQEKVMPFLQNEDIEKLSVVFKFFLTATDHKSFDLFYEKYKNKKDRKFKTKLFLLKFIPFGTMRKSLRKKIRREYHKL